MFYSWTFLPPNKRESDLRNPNFMSANKKTLLMMIPLIIFLKLNSSNRDR